MGAEDFSIGALGKTAEDAFSRAIEDARYEHGHGGYTGTIAEKAGDGFVMFAIKARTNPLDVVGKLRDAQDAFAYEQDPDSEWTRKPTAKQRNALAWLRDRVSVVPVKRNPDPYSYGYKPRPSDAAITLIECTNSKYGACACIEVTGQRAAKIKEQRGRKGTHDKVFLFFGMASC